MIQRTETTSEVSEYDLERFISGTSARAVRSNSIKNGIAVGNRADSRFDGKQGVDLTYTRQKNGRELCQGLIQGSQPRDANPVDAWLMATTITGIDINRCILDGPCGEVRSVGDDVRSTRVVGDESISFILSKPNGNLVREYRHEIKGQRSETFVVSQFGKFQGYSYPKSSVNTLSTKGDSLRIEEEMLVFEPGPVSQANFQMEYGPAGTPVVDRDTGEEYKVSTSGALVDQHSTRIQTPTRATSPGEGSIFILVGAGSLLGGFILWFQYRLRSRKK